jgi:CSLREA domain-containing protein
MHWTSIAILVLASLTLFIFLPAPSPALGASIQVTTFEDEDNTDGDCSLREAVKSAADDTAYDACAPGSGADVISLPAGTYLLTDEIVLYGDLEINGSGYGSTFIDGANASRIFRRSGPAAPLTVRYLTFRFGHAPSDGFGSCFYQSSGYTTTMVSVRFFQCHSDGRGGAIYNAGSITLEDSLLIQNSATGHPSGSNSGGAIYMTSGDLTLLRTRFIDNVTVQSGGGGNGGAIHFGSNGSLNVTDSYFSGNVGYAGGGVMAGGTVNISGSTFSDNSASFGGGLYFGGTAGDLSIVNSTFHANDEGALYNAGDAFIFNSTFANNTTDPTLINTGNLTLKNTILYRADGDNCVTPMTSAGYNLENTNSCGLAGTGDLINTDPLLGTFDWYGGETQTISLQSQSPALDAGDPAGCVDDVGGDLLSDQRGFPRPVDGDLDGTPRCDIGAYERELWMQYLPLVLR